MPLIESDPARRLPAPKNPQEFRSRCHAIFEETRLNDEDIRRRREVLEWMRQNKILPGYSYKSQQKASLRLRELVALKLEDQTSISGVILNLAANDGGIPARGLLDERRLSRDEYIAAIRDDGWAGEHEIAALQELGISFDMIRPPRVPGQPIPNGTLFYLYNDSGNHFSMGRGTACNVAGLTTGYALTLDNGSCFYGAYLQGLTDYVIPVLDSSEKARIIADSEQLMRDVDARTSEQYAWQITRDGHRAGDIPGYTDWRHKREARGEDAFMVNAEFRARLGAIPELTTVVKAEIIPPASEPTSVDEGVSPDTNVTSMLGVDSEKIASDDCPKIPVTTGLISEIKHLIDENPITWQVIKWSLIALALTSLIFLTGGFGAIPVVGVIVAKLGLLSILAITPIMAGVLCGLWYGLVKPLSQWMIPRVSASEAPLVDSLSENTAILGSPHVLVTGLGVTSTSAPIEEVDNKVVVMQSPCHAVSLDCADEPPEQIKMSKP